MIIQNGYLHDATQRSGFTEQEGPCDIGLFILTWIDEDDPISTSDSPTSWNFSLFWYDWWDISRYLNELRMKLDE